MSRVSLSSSALLLLAIAACSTTFEPQPCGVDGDCNTGFVCELRDAVPVCVEASAAPLVIGESAPVSGPNQALGTGMKLGIELAFEEQNAAGGIRGRELKLEFRDDQYDPMLAEQAARSLVDAQLVQAAPKCPTTTMPAVPGQDPISSQALERGPDAVLAFLGNVGTPTMVRAAPVAIETGTIFFGAFTGATTILRDDKAAGCRSYIFNVRASYSQEARATMEYFKQRGVADHRHLISFDQNDSFGQAGYDGLVQAYKDVVGNFPGSADPINPIVRFRYVRNDDSSVAAQVTAAQNYLVALLSGNTDIHTIGIFMTDTYGAGAEFIESLRRWQYADDSQQQSLNKAARLKLNFSNVSFVGSNALSDRLVSSGTVLTPSGASLPYTDGVMVSQVVPNYQSDSSDLITSYNRLIVARGAQPTFTSLEGYVAARVFIAGLLAHKGPFTPETLVKTFERLPDLSLGIGASSGFSADNHQYSNSVWGTSIEPDGSFKNTYFWTEGSAIEFFE
ncbi:MAG TPA: ABC transporter substrate-binding protein [Kofleriaceae bacterium]|nr:ABC transporter substrate-binding protein [Kofleriaceae bacterium]